ncbi:MAG TPA: pyridoxamine 5'-phosphate oxidase [Vicinamibacterales bacterium]|nr:pyridoxamine 5'-phosphate oxidase [Vicinamibacterales bacterium]
MSSGDPIEIFLRASARAAERGVDTAPVALATADAGGRPSVRMVLIRHVDARGFVFHTNYDSRKAADLASNPRAALCFHWVALEEQIRVEGAVERLEAAESDAYFATRARGSQIGAWASAQSAELPSRETLQDRVREAAQRFEGHPVPRPAFWGGFRLIPDRIEFWTGRPDRLHERVVFVRDRDTWRRVVLYP